MSELVNELGLKHLILQNCSFAFRKLAVLSALQLVKVEGVKFEASFMSEQATLFLSSIGLLGGYCPKSRKKNRHTAEELGCMHLGLLEGTSVNSLGCRFMRPFSIATNSTGKGAFLATIKTSSDLCIF